MKPIVKSSEPTIFAAWKATHPRATYKTDLCNKNDVDAVAAKCDLKQSLLSEQKFICCYCECRISLRDSHIEHFQPKGKYASLQLDYNNLHASCTKEPTGTNDEHCGHKKGNYFSIDLVSPLEPDCSSHFTYQMDGTIHGCDNRGVETVKRLHLDSALLNSQRKNMIDHFLDINDDIDLQKEISHHLDNNVATLGEFFTMVEYLHNNGQL